MLRYLDVKTVISALVVAAFVSAAGILGNSMLLNYKFDELDKRIGILKIEKVDKVLVDQLRFEIVALKSEKADRALVEAKWTELQKGIGEIKGELKSLVWMHIENKGKIQ